METYEDLNPGKYLSANDVKTKRFNGTVERVDIEEMSDKKRKHVVYFKGQDRGVVLNKTRYSALAEIAGTNKPEKWKGTKVVLFAGKTNFGGKSVACIEIEAADDELDADEAALRETFA